MENVKFKNINKDGDHYDYDNLYLEFKLSKVYSI